MLLQTIEGRQAIAPAEKWEKKHNAENGELYPVFPFRCFGLALGTGDLVAWTMKHRSCKDAFGCACWTQDQIHWACAGQAAEAADGLVRRFRIASPMCRFPLYGREGPDSCPDFDHFGAGSVALQRMLVQEAGDKIFLLPAWPADWDVGFQTAPGAAGGALRNREGRQADRLGHPAGVAEEGRGGLPAAARQAAGAAGPGEQPSASRRFRPERRQPLPRPDRSRDHVPRQAARRRRFASWPPATGRSPSRPRRSSARG